MITHLCVKKSFIAGVLLASGLSASPCYASDGFTSEFSHLASGAAMAGYITHLYGDSENRAWIGFGISTVIVIAEQNYEIAKTGKRSSQQLDMAAHAIGSALGAWYTDKYLLLPVIKRNSVGFTLIIPID
jgi:hypothetical protein